MNFIDHVALVTGTSRGIGRRYVEELQTRGVRKIYATARRPEAVDIPGVEVLHLDLNDPESIATAATRAPDVTLLVNNAGISTSTPLVTGDIATIRSEIDTHFWGTLMVTRAFAPVLAANGGGAIVNILSALSWFSYPGNGAYGVAKAAEWNMTNAVRLELAAQNTFVQGVHLGAADTDIMAGYDGPMIDPRDVPRASLTVWKGATSRSSSTTGAQRSRPRSPTTLDRSTTPSWPTSGEGLGDRVRNSCLAGQ